jgi:hypothetical protein
MGNTCASIHIAWRGAAEDASKAISRSYSKLGYKRVKKAPAALRLFFDATLLPYRRPLRWRDPQLLVLGNEERRGTASVEGG